MEENMQPQQPAPEPKVESSDAEKNKVMAIVGYILPILFFIPLLSEESKKSPFAKFHANQQLVLLLTGIAGWIAVSILSVLLGITIILIVLIPIIWVVFQIALLVFAILGIINAAKGEMKKLPIIGGFEIIK